ncbi:hypothetical protein L21SP5_00538 [Salinivirga cyanobacteriivorans]|uniref:Uncharacterized protein n=1 Tax=Salinivirga cyanobacteriivorans TaxID=1307839 RepID=A0A0S2HW27_9BACT|nr:hypothetical protein L21SP5_00538 [Salinivirga cyanobacteriivorans]
MAHENVSASKIKKEKEVPFFKVTSSSILKLPLVVVMTKRHNV